MEIQLGKILTVLLSVEFFLVLAIIAMSSSDSKRLVTAYVVRESEIAKKNDFKILTRAVCGEESGEITCHDRLFVKCSGKEYLVKEGSFAVCNNVTLDLSGLAANGSVKFRKLK